MPTCIFSVFLFIFPVLSHEPDEWRNDVKITGCNNSIDRWWIKNHAFYLEVGNERVRIPLPPVKEPLETWMTFNLDSDRVKMGEWGLIYVQRGPKDPV